MGFHSFITRVSIYAFGLGASILIARALGPEGRGRYFLPVALIGITAAVGNLGTYSAMLRLWARKRGTPDEFVTSNVVLTVTLSVVWEAVLWLVFWLFQDAFFASIRPADLAIASVALPFSLHGPRSGYLLGIAGHIRRTNRARLLGAVAQTLGIGALYLVGKLSVPNVLALFVVSIALPALIVTWHLRAIGKLARPVPWRLIRDHLSLGVFLGPSAMLQHINLRLDVFFLARFRGEAAVGIYSIAVTLSELSWLATDALTFAVVTRQVNAREAEAADITARGVRMNLFLALIFGGLIALASPLILPLLYGQPFLAAVPAIWILVPAAAAMAAWRSTNQGLVRFAAPWILPTIGTAALLINVAANFVLIPRFGMVGAALASVVCYAIGAIAAARVLMVAGGIRPRQLVPGREEIKTAAELLRDLAHRRSPLVTEVDDDVPLRPQ